MFCTKIELLSPDILTKYPEWLNDLDFLSAGLFKEFGWHYPVDIVWILSELERLGLKKGSTILDAGAGNGILQYLLSYYGYHVISVDFSPRKRQLIPALIFPLEEDKQDVKFENAYVDHIVEVSRLRYKVRRLYFMIKYRKINPFSFLKLLYYKLTSQYHPGKISMYCANVLDMSDIPSQSIDAVVSLSAVEHMSPDDIPQALIEFERVVKPGGGIVVSTSASKDTDWFHTPSKGWCFSKKSLSKLFGLENDSAFVFEDYERILSGYNESKALKKRLSSVYFASSRNGMPLGNWAPQYLPVGIVKYVG